MINGTDFRFPLASEEYRWINPLDPKRHQAFQILSLNRETITVLDLQTNQKIILKASGFDSPVNSQHLITMAMSKENYLAFKTTDKILVYDKKTGEFYWEISLPGAEIHVGLEDNQTLICNENYLASIEEKGRVLRVWNLKEKSLHWENRFEEQPFHHCRNTYNLHFKGDTSPILSWQWSQESWTPTNLWLFNLNEKKFIDGMLKGQRPDACTIMAISPNMIGEYWEPIPFFKGYTLNNQYLPNDINDIFIRIPQKKREGYITGREGRTSLSGVKNIYIREKFVAIGISYFNESKRADCYTRLVVLDMVAKKIIMDQPINNFNGSSVFLTADSIWMSGSLRNPETKISKPTLLKYSYDPDEGMKKPTPVINSAKDPVIQTPVLQKNLWERIVDYAKRIFIVLFSPFKWIGHRGLKVLKLGVETCIKVIRFPLHVFK